MAATSTRKPRRSGSFVWGPRRLARGISIRDLEMASGIGRGYLSEYENGKRAVPARHFEAVMAALETGSLSIEHGGLPGASISTDS